MLFLAKHVHTAENCPAVKGNVMQTLGKIATDTKSGVKLKHLYVDSPAHTMYLIIEADKVSQLQDFFDPGLGVGTAHITPIEDGAEKYMN